MKKLLSTLFAGLAVLMTSCGSQSESIPAEVTMSKDTLMDKIKGGWAGQVIGVSYGAMTEFKFPGAIIPDNMPIDYSPGCIKNLMLNNGGLYDDIYMDLTFVDAFERHGLDVSADTIAMAFANAEYPLWHANQAARYNILRGIMPPESGHWINNPHADDIDYQIEADYAGLMSPGMPNTASEISDKVGHIMNYGDGWYGGVYMGAMYSLAFVSNDIEYIVTEALKTIPERSHYYKVINKVIETYKSDPADWRQAWAEVEKIYADVAKHCPEGIYHTVNIDAAYNSAYVVIGLLYGNGDFGKTVDISTRCGSDSDCNPASAAGILGTMIGYSNIPTFWLDNVKEAEDIPFTYTDISLNKTYDMSYRQALQVIDLNGGSTEGENVTIKTQKPEPVRFEQSFEGIYPGVPIETGNNIDQFFARPGQETAKVIEFEGTGISLCGGMGHPNNSYVGEFEAIIDGQPAGKFTLPVDFRTRCYDVYWKYGLPQGKHTITFRWLNPEEGAQIWPGKVIPYTNTPFVQNLGNN